MKKGILVLIFLFLSLTILSCETSKPKKVEFSDLKDVSVKILDKSFDFSKIKLIIIYSKQENEDELATLSDLNDLLTKNNYSVIMDTGDDIDYGKEQLRMRTSHKLMSIMHYIYFLKGGTSQPKGNEDIIAIVKADSAEKAAQTALKLLKHNKK